jgi:hypothetical protein
MSQLTSKKRHFRLRFLIRRLITLLKNTDPANGALGLIDFCFTDDYIHEDVPSVGHGDLSHNVQFGDAMTATAASGDDNRTGNGNNTAFRMRLNMSDWNPFGASAAFDGSGGGKAQAKYLNGDGSSPNAEGKDGDVSGDVLNDHQGSGKRVKPLIINRRNQLALLNAGVHRKILALIQHFLGTTLSRRGGGGSGIGGKDGVDQYMDAEDFEDYEGGADREHAAGLISEFFRSRRNKALTRRSTAGVASDDAGAGGGVPSSQRPGAAGSSKTTSTSSPAMRKMNEVITFLPEQIELFRVCFLFLRAFIWDNDACLHAICTQENVVLLIKSRRLHSEALQLLKDLFQANRSGIHSWFGKAELCIFASDLSYVSYWLRDRATAITAAEIDTRTNARMNADMNSGTGTLTANSTARQMKTKLTPLGASTASATTPDLRVSFQRKSDSTMHGNSPLSSPSPGVATAIQLPAAPLEHLSSFLISASVAELGIIELMFSSEPNFKLIPLWLGLLNSGGKSNNSLHQTAPKKKDRGTNTAWSIHRDSTLEATSPSSSSTTLKPRRRVNSFQSLVNDAVDYNGFLLHTISLGLGEYESLDEKKLVHICDRYSQGTTRSTNSRRIEDIETDPIVDEVVYDRLVRMSERWPLLPEEHELRMHLTFISLLGTSAIYNSVARATVHVYFPTVHLLLKLALVDKHEVRGPYLHLLLGIYFSWRFESTSAAVSRSFSTPTAPLLASSSAAGKGVGANANKGKRPLKSSVSVGAQPLRPAPTSTAESFRSPQNRTLLKGSCFFKSYRSFHCPFHFIFFLSLALHFATSLSSQRLSSSI